MSERLSINGDDDAWKVFSKTPQSGKVTFFRSRSQNPAVQAYARDNQMARVRCVLAADQVAETGLPKSTKDLDDFEDSLLGALTSADAEVSLIAVVTGDGVRDLFFAARDLDDLRAGIKAATNAPTISLQLAPVGDKEPFLKVLTLSEEQEQAATKQVMPQQGSGFLGKLFGR